MRKFYSTDFNELTRYIKRKRYRGIDYFGNCLDYYMSLRFSQLYHSFNRHIRNRDSLLHNANRHVYNDNLEQLLFLGCLIYPKDIKAAAPHILSTAAEELGGPVLHDENLRRKL
jgi:hypothetical protein